MPIDFPDDFFGPPEARDENWPDHPDVRRAVVWFKGFMPEDEWKARRLAAAQRLYSAAMGDLPAGDRGRFFDDADAFGWYLFVADAFLDHVWNLEPVFASRIVPVFAAIGRDLDALTQVPGLEDRVRRFVGAERRSPHGGLFELLVAAAYLRAGGSVAFVAEEPGRRRTHDMDVTINGRVLAVECKRMEVGEYGERERMRMRELWQPSCSHLVQQDRSTLCDAHFLVPISDVPDDYLSIKVRQWLETGQPSFAWRDDVGFGTVATLNLSPLQAVLENDYVLMGSTRLFELLTGEYIRHANYVQVVGVRPGENPRYIDECSLAVLLRWESLSAEATDAKARDVFRKLAEANDQLPTDRPGVVHIGFETVEGDTVERARHDKILASAARFDPEGKPLEYVYCHYFVPESPPDQSWAYDETTQWCPIRPSGPPPLVDAFLVVPNGAEQRPGPHWQA